MIGAIYSGLFGLSSPSTFNCSSTNCTWPDEYVSIGFSSSCDNVTESSVYNISSPGNSNNEHQFWTINTPKNNTINAEFSSGYGSLVAVSSSAASWDYTDCGTGDPYLSWTSTGGLVNFAVF
jgi:hypothetical protein